MNFKINKKNFRESFEVKKKIVYNSEINLAKQNFLEICSEVAFIFYFFFVKP